MPSLSDKVSLARRTAAFALSVWLVLLSLAGASAQAARRAQSSAAQSAEQSAPRPRSAAEAARPRLVLLITVDQLRYDYLERFGDLFVANGIARLLREGASWTNAHYDHVPTYTAPGHATIATGTWPAENGIIANEWFDRETGRNITSVSDEQAQLFGGGASERASSPRRLTASTIGDELRLATNGQARVIGISSKDRSAILPAGRAGSAAYWLSISSGRMVSSNYYFPQLPAWVARFNDARPAERFFGARWERLLPEAEYTRRAGEDAPAWERPQEGGPSFPHVITGGLRAPGAEFYEELNYSPFTNDLIYAFAQEAITQEALGADEDTDLLSISFSANDYIGHRFGPYSHEVMDITLRTDRQIAALLDFVEARVGLRNTLVVLTADHGVSPSPEHAHALNLLGGRLVPRDVLATVRSAVRARYPRPGNEAAQEQTDGYIQAFVNGQFYFNLEALRRDQISRAELERIVGEAALAVPGITRYFTRTQLEAGNAGASTDAVARRVRHGFHAQRSGDVVVIYEAYKNLTSSRSGATHGSPYSYDTHVPLILMGEGIAPGRYAQAAAPSDIAPTLAQLLRVTPPSNATGRVLLEAMRMRAEATAGAAR